MKPLPELIKKEGFARTTLNAFEELNKAMTKFSLSVLPNFSQPFKIESDASKKSIGAVL